MPMSGSRKPDGSSASFRPAYAHGRRAHLALDTMLTRLLADEPIAFTYEARERRLVWDQGEVIPGLDPTTYRKCPRTGAILCYGHLGHAHLRSGWDYGHAYSPEWGGLDCLSNMRPEQCADYRPMRTVGSPRQAD